MVRMDAVREAGHVGNPTLTHQANIISTKLLVLCAPQLLSIKDRDRK